VVKTTKRPPHPGWACCDLSQDLAGWLDREAGRAADLRERARDIRAAAIEADRRALRALSIEAENERRTLHGEANALAQSAMIIEGHAERVRAAHLWRLDVEGRES
jgi:hypothetical protein